MSNSDSSNSDISHSDSSNSDSSNSDSSNSESSDSSSGGSSISDILGKITLHIDNQWDFLGQHFAILAMFFLNYGVVFGPVSLNLPRTD